MANSRLGTAMVPGFHLEGPFLNPAPGFAGCHPPGAMRPPDPALLQRLAAPLARPILLLTLAPEQSGGMAMIVWARAQGMLVAIGHSAADDDGGGRGRERRRRPQHPSRQRPAPHAGRSSATR